MTFKKAINISLIFVLQICFSSLVYGLDYELEKKSDRRSVPKPSGKIVVSEIPRKLSDIKDNKVFLTNVFLDSKKIDEKIIITKAVYWINQGIKKFPKEKLYSPYVIKRILGANTVTENQLQDGYENKQTYSVMVREKILFKKIDMYFKMNLTVNNFSEITSGEPKSFWQIQDLPGVRADDLLMTSTQYDFSKVTGQKAFTGARSMTWFLRVEGKTLVLLLQKSNIKKTFLESFGVKGFIKSTITKRLVDSYKFMKSGL